MGNMKKRELAPQSVSLFPRFLLIMVFLLAIPNTSRAADNISVTVQGGLFIPDDDSNSTLSTGPAGEVQFGYSLTPLFAVEGGIGYFKTELSFRGTDHKYEITGTPVTLTLKSMMPGENFIYSIGLGAGIYYENLKTTSGSKIMNADANPVGYHLYIRDDFFIGTHWYAGFELKFFWIQRAEFNDNGGRVRVGLHGNTLLGNVGFRF